MKLSIGPLTILAFIFITLKLCGTIAWSWGWVLSPIWIPLVLLGGLFLGGIIAALVVAVIRDFK